LADFAAHVLARHSRQTQVQHQHRRRGRAKHCQTINSVPGHVYGESFSFKQSLESFLDGSVILNHQYALRTGGDGLHYRSLRS
jgi:hypothetical protein